jgi:hypothetical protein
MGWGRFFVRIPDYGRQKPLQFTWSSKSLLRFFQNSENSEILTAVVMGIPVFRNATQRNVADENQRIEKMLTASSALKKPFYPEDIGSNLLQNFGQCVAIKQRSIKYSTEEPGQETVFGYSVN